MHRFTRQRDAIETVLASTRGPLSPQEIREQASRTVPTLNLATVYRTLRLLVEDGRVEPVQLPGEPNRYELRQTARLHHHHFRCEICSSVFDLEGCADGLRDLVPKGFRMTGHDIVLHGVCRRCAA